MRKLVADAAPDAVEEFSYAMIGYKLQQKPLIYFGAYKKHIGVYALPQTHILFAEQLAAYKKGKGSVQFLHSQDLPMVLIRKMIQFRLSALNKDA